MKISASKSFLLSIWGLVGTDEEQELKSKWNYLYPHLRIASIARFVCLPALYDFMFWGCALDQLSEFHGEHLLGICLDTTPDLKHLVLLVGFTINKGHPGCPGGKPANMGALEEGRHSIQANPMYFTYMGKVVRCFMQIQSIGRV